MNIVNVIRIDRDRLARQFNRLVITLQPEMVYRLAAVPKADIRIVWARPNCLVEKCAPSTPTRRARCSRPTSATVSLSSAPQTHLRGRWPWIVLETSECLLTNRQPADFPPLRRPLSRSGRPLYVDPAVAERSLGGQESALLRHSLMGTECSI
jgi:hypothetical protein